MNISKVVENHDLAGNQKQVKCVVAAAFNLGTNSLICYSPTCCLLNQKNFVTFKEISKFNLHLILVGTLGNGRDCGKLNRVCLI